MTIDSCLCREPAVESGAIITVTTQYTDDNGRWWERQNSRCLGLCSDLLLKLKKEIEITGMVSIISVASHTAAQSTAQLHILMLAGGSQPRVQTAAYGTRPLLC